MAYSVSGSNTLDATILQDLDASSTAQMHPLGYMVESTDGRKYKYVITHDGCVATDLAGHPAYYMCATTTGPCVTTDASEAATTQGGLGGSFAGLTCKAGLTASAEVYIWIEVPNGAVTPDASVSTNCAASSALSAIGTADAYLDVFVNGASTKIVAIALEADASNLADIIMLPEPGAAA